MRLAWDRIIGRRRAQGYEVVEAEICVIGVGTVGKAAMCSTMEEPIAGVRHMFHDPHIGYVECIPKVQEWTKIGGQGYQDGDSSGKGVDRRRLRQQSSVKQLPGNPDLVLIAAEMGDVVAADIVPIVCHHAKETGAMVGNTMAISTRHNATRAMLLRTDIISLLKFLLLPLTCPRK